MARARNNVTGLPIRKTGLISESNFLKPDTPKNFQTAQSAERRRLHCTVNARPYRACRLPVALFFLEALSLKRLPLTSSFRTDELGDEGFGMARS